MSASTSEHPLRAAMLARDEGALQDLLADDVVLFSPVTRFPFAGKERVGQLLHELIVAYETLEYLHQWSDGDLHALWFRVRIGGRSIETVDVIRDDADGRIAEIRVHSRPLAATAVYAAALGPGLAPSRLRAAVIRLTTRGLPRMLERADAFGKRLLG